MFGLAAVLIDGQHEYCHHRHQQRQDEEDDEDVRGEVALVWGGESLQTVDLVCNILTLESAMVWSCLSQHLCSADFSCGSISSSISMSARLSSK